MTTIMKKYLIPFLTISLLVAVIVIGRAIPHWPNFAPVAAVGLFAGFLFRKKWLALAVPMIGMGISDLLFGGLYDWNIMIFVYAGLSLPALLGSWVNQTSDENKSRFRNFIAKTTRVATVAGSASLFFFIVSNLAVWFFDPMYAVNLKGLVACFAMAIPFFKFTLAGDLFFSMVLFGGFGLASLLTPSLKESFAFVRK
jgi:hypothetical protein